MRKGKMKRWASVICVLLAMIMTLSACGGGADSGVGSSGDGGSQEGGSTDTGSDESTEPAQDGGAGAEAEDSGGWHVEENTLPIADGDVELTIYCGFAGGARQIYNSMEDMDIVKKMEEETGIKLHFVHPPENDDGTFFTTMIASGDYPDIISDGFASYPGGATAAMDDGVLLDATELIQSKAYYYYHMMDDMDPEVREKRIWSDDGRITWFGTVFAPEYLDGRVHGGFLVRKDILDKAGITELPETYEEYEEMFEAFKAEGLVPWSLAMKEWQFRDYSPVASGLGVTVRNTHLDGDKVIYSRTAPEYKEFLEIMHKWYEKGYINSDALTQSTSEAQKKFQAGEAGAILCGSWEIVTLEAVGQANDPDLEIVALPFPRKNKGDAIDTMKTFILNPDGRKGYISAKCEHPEEAVRFVDYLYKPETIMMTAWGVNTDEHTLWTEDADGNRDWTEFMTDNPDFDYEIGRQRYTANVLQGSWETIMEKKQYDIPQVQQAWSEDAWFKNTSYSGLVSPYMTQTTDEAREISQLLTQIETYGDEMMFKFITGERSIDEFDTFVEEIKGMGTDRLCELYQAAHDRYLSR